LTEEVSEAGDGVIGVANKEGLGLATVVLVAVNVGENGRDLSIFIGKYVSEQLFNNSMERNSAEMSISETYLRPRWQ
jgi:hypothetical protein